MTTITLELNTIKELIQVLRLVKENQINAIIVDEYNPTTVKMFQDMVNEYTGSKNLLKGALLDSYVNMLQTNEMDFTKQMKATPEWKYFSGSEWLNKDGCISVNSAVERIICHATFNNLIHKDTITFDNALMAALKTELTQVDVARLPVLVYRSIFNSTTI
jgi:hypothetical protein